MARDPKHDVLFESITLGPKKTRNRFWQTSHCAGPGSERPGAQAHLRGMKAEGGWGVVFTEYCSIHPEADEYPYTSARIWDEGDISNLGYMCEVAHRHGSLAGIQLWYSGGNATSLESREFGRGPSQWLSPLFATRSVYGYEMDEFESRRSSTCTSKPARGPSRPGSICSRCRPETIPFPFNFSSRASTRGPINTVAVFANRSRFFHRTAARRSKRALAAG